MVLTFAVSQDTPFNIWPVPQQWTNGSSTLTVQKNDNFFSVVGKKSDILNQAIQRYNTIIFLGPPQDVTFKRNTRQEHPLDDVNVIGCLVNVKTDDQTLQLGFDETYTLSISSGGDCSITANTVYGALRGLETFSQVVDYDWSGNFFIRNIPFSIIDYPRYSHRGLLVDTSRHYFAVDVLKSVIDVMAFNKFNTLHWHIVDDQSFPYVSTTYPSLSNMGAYNPTRAIYTPDQVQDIITYAKYRGVRVMPEFDMPAHTASWTKGYPILLGNANCGFDPTLGTTYIFIENLFKEIRSVFLDNYIHIGGDELDFKCWQTPPILDWMKKNGINSTADLENFFETKVLALAAKYNIHPMVWQELFNNGLKLAPSTVIEVWKGADYQTLKEVVQAGYQATMSGFWYLDHLADTWETFYQKDIDEAGLTPDQAKLVIGGEACMWAEHVDYTNIQERVWPRASAIAEVLWSSKKFSKVPAAAEPRLHQWKCRMNRRGYNASPVGPGNFCNPLSTE
jgi:hexosaminidase